MKKQKKSKQTKQKKEYKPSAITKIKKREKEIRERLEKLKKEEQKLYEKKYTQRRPPVKKEPKKIISIQKPREYTQEERTKQAVWNYNPAIREREKAVLDFVKAKKEEQVRDKITNFRQQQEKERLMQEVRRNIRREDWARRNIKAERANLRASMVAGKVGKFGARAVDFVDKSGRHFAKSSQKVSRSAEKGLKSIAGSFGYSKKLSSSLLNIGAGGRPQGQRVKEGPGRPRGDFKHRDPYTGKPIPATLFYKRIKDFRRDQQQKAQQVDQQVVQQLAKRGIPPEQAKQIVDTRQLQSVGVQPQVQNGVVPMSPEMQRQLMLQAQMQNQPRPIQQSNYPSQAVRPIWRRQNMIRVETDMLGNKKEVLSGNDPRNFWN